MCRASQLPILFSTKPQLAPPEPKSWAILFPQPLCPLPSPFPHQQWPTLTMQAAQHQGSRLQKQVKGLVCFWRCPSPPEGSTGRKGMVQACCTLTRSDCGFKMCSGNCGEGFPAVHTRGVLPAGQSRAEQRVAVTILGWPILPETTLSPAFFPFPQVGGWQRARPFWS